MKKTAICLRHEAPAMISSLGGSIYIKHLIKIRMYASTDGDDIFLREYNAMTDKKAEWVYSGK